jgi:YHS domain-containing protein
MIRFILLRIILPLLLLLLARALLRSLFAARKTAVSQKPRAEPPAAQPGAELKKDPVCGTYVSTATGISRTFGGQAVYFCSKECRDKYRVA